MRCKFPQNFYYQTKSFMLVYYLSASQKPSLHLTHIASTKLMKGYDFFTSTASQAIEKDEILMHIQSRFGFALNLYH